jgi:endonuclease/exonuclease/phosphatase family metal-dependent hydrolase
VSAWGSGLPSILPESITLMVIFRLLGGIAIGIASMNAPMYIAEIAPAKKRGNLVTFYQLAIVIGFFVVFLATYFIGNGMSEQENITTGWRYMFWSELIPASLFLVLLFFVPKSPRWLMLKGREDEAKAILVRIHGEKIANKEIVEIRDSIINFIQSEQPDILCLQEYYADQSGKFETGTLLSKGLGDVNVHKSFSVQMHGQQSYGMASFLKYPIFHTGEIQFENSNNLVQFTDFIFQKDTLRLYNIHLQSLHFDDKNYKDLDNLQVKKINKKQLGSIRNIMHKFAYASKQRARQSDSVKNHINQSPYPVILCGDFNDTPGSYAYSVLSKDLKDAFRKSGRGLGFSYQRGFLRMRIDHILHDNSLKSYGFKTKNVKYSDHFPVSCYLSAK